MSTKQPYTLTRAQLPTADVAYGRLAQAAYNMLHNRVLMSSLERSNPVAASVVREVLAVLERLRTVLGERVRG